MSGVGDTQAKIGQLLGSQANWRKVRLNGLAYPVYQMVDNTPASVIA